MLEVLQQNMQVMADSAGVSVIALFVLMLFIVSGLAFSVYWLTADVLEDLTRKRQVTHRFYQFQQNVSTNDNGRKKISEWLMWLPVTDKDRIELGRLLSQAGFRDPNAIFVLVALKLIGLVVIPAFIWLSAEGGFGLGLLFKLTVAALVGSMAPEWWLKRRAQHNMEQLRNAIPDAVDLMVICAESGLHIDAMLNRVAQDIQDWSPILAEELNYTYADIQIGTERQRALAALAHRTQVNEIEYLVTALLQADKYGTPLVKALKDLADETRRLHLLSLEERIGKVPATMTLPVMIFVLIPLVILLAGPSVVLLIRQLQAL